MSDGVAILPDTMSQNHSHVFMNIILIKRKKVEHVVSAVSKIRPADQLQLDSKKYVTRGLPLSIG